MSTIDKQSPGFLGPGMYPWWAAGVGVASVLVATAAGLLLPQFKTSVAWFFIAIGGGAVFLCAFDSQGVFRPWRMVFSIAIVLVVYRFLPLARPSLPPRVILVLCVSVILFVYLAAGGLGVAIGNVVQSRRNAKGNA